MSVCLRRRAERRASADKLNCRAAFAPRRRLASASTICATALLTAAAFVLPVPDDGARAAGREIAPLPTHMNSAGAGAG
jgi:hypothetical protein